MTRNVSNWSGSLSFTPKRLIEAASEDEVADAVARVAHAGGTVRAIGAGHSSSPLVATDGTLLSLSRLSGLLEVDAGSRQAVIGGGTLLHDAGMLFAQAGLSLSNLGDVDSQTVVGAMATGTHGTGAELPVLSSHIIGAHVVDGCGDVVALGGDERTLDSFRVSLGCVGVVTQLSLQLVPMMTLRRDEWCAGTREALGHLDELVTGNRNFDFYWYPRSDEVKLRTLNLPGQGMQEIPFACLQRRSEGPAHEVLPRERELRFDEMEYFLPRQAAPRAFLEIRKRIRKRWRREVCWRVLYRTVAPDSTCLSGAQGRASATISVHHNAGLPYEDYFADIEPVLRDYGGRPHWGKRHSLRARDLAPLYPRWDDFMQLRAQLDPNGTFLTPYLRELLGV